MSRIVLITGVSMVAAAITVYLIEVFDVLLPLLLGTALVGISGLVSILNTE